MTWRTQAGILPEAAASVVVIGRQPADNAESRAVEVVLALVVAALVLGGLSLAFRSNSLVADLPITEDAYYAFSVSSHVAHGDGVTVDGVEATNGFQPLFTFLTVPLFVGDDPFVPLRLSSSCRWGSSPLRDGSLGWWFAMRCRPRVRSGGGAWFSCPWRSTWPLHSPCGSISTGSRPGLSCCSTP